MLRRFLFIGVGGSGGKTLRFLREALTDRLAQAGWRGDFPACWQMVQIDVPAEDDAPAGGKLPPILPQRCYTGLAEPDLSYRSHDARLVQNGGASVVRHFATWRPRPQDVHIDVSAGAGQFRAIGRVILGATIGDAVQAVDDALHVLNTPASRSELDKVNRLLGVEVTGADTPLAVVVGSLGGGSGSGTFMDVCDLLRFKGGPGTWHGKSVGVLYTPDVFDYLDPLSRGGVQANGLASLSELLAGFWNNSAPSPDEFAQFQAGGIPLPGATLERRGPRYPMLVGAANDSVSYPDAIDVFRSTAHALAAIATSEHVQSRLTATVLANWDANKLEDVPLIPPLTSKPCRSFGFASVGLGRERFAEYAAERLARTTLDRLLKAHWAKHGVPDDVRPEVAAEREANQNIDRVRSSCGLDELTRERNQIIDAIRPSGDDDQNLFLSTAARIREESLERVTRNREEATPDEWVESILGEITRRESEFFGVVRPALEKSANQWAHAVQARIEEVLSGEIGRLGLPVTLELLDLLREHLVEVGKDLRAEAEEMEQWTTRMDSRVRSVVQSSGRRIVAAKDQDVREGVKAGTDAFWYRSEGELRRIALRLVDDLSRSFLKPLRDALDRSLTRLQTQADDPSSGAVDWALDEVPMRLYPAVNEQLLVDVKEYPHEYERLVRLTVPEGTALRADHEAAADVAAGRIDREAPDAVVSIVDRWIPDDERLRMTASPQPARFTIDLGVTEILERARRWIRRPQTAIGDHCAEEIGAWLDNQGLDARGQQNRLAAFRSGLQRTLGHAEPLILVNPEALDAVHRAGKFRPTPLVTPMPFPVGHPARSVAEEVLDSYGVPNAQIDGFFGESGGDTIEIASFLPASVNPAVVDSVTVPIRGDWDANSVDPGRRVQFWRWRRSRPLPGFVPVPPETRVAMVRGWLTAIVLKKLEWGDPSGPVRVAPDKGGAWVSFPHPFLSSVTDDHDVLPAVLESLPLALLDVATDGVGVLDGYVRLRDLGLDGSGQDAYVTLHPELRDWLLAEGEEAVGTDRRERLRSFLEGYVRLAQDLDAVEVTDTSWSSLPVLWEMRHDLERAAQELLDALGGDDPRRTQFGDLPTIGGGGSATWKH